MLDRAFVRFLLTGGLAAVVNIGSRVLFSMVMPFGAAVVAAYVCGMTTAYVLARLFVFERSGQTVGSEFLRFTLVNLVALVQVWLISVGLADWLFPAIHFNWNADLVAHTVGVLSPVVSSYYGHKLFTFRQAADR